jgi:F-type H+-transporting ATPase subunit a
MGTHYTFLGQIISSPDLERLVTGVLVGTAITAVGYLATRSLTTPEGIQSNLVPASKPKLTSILDAMVGAFVGYYDSLLGKNNRQHLPFCASIFFFLLISNLIGLIPGVSTPTNTVWINVGMAFVVFFYFNYVAIKSQGVWGYLRHTMGPSIFLAFLIFPIEVFSLCMRVFTLNLRLFWNISADHLVLGIFTDLIKGFAFPFYLLGTFVSFMQAFVFTTLTMVYILLASQHGEEGH